MAAGDIQTIFIQRSVVDGSPDSAAVSSGASIGADTFLGVDINLREGRADGTMKYDIILVTEATA